MGTIAEKMAYLNGTKTAIKNAIVEKGVEIPEGTTFRQYAEKIAAIPSGGGTFSIETNNGSISAPTEAAAGDRISCIVLGYFSAAIYDSARNSIPATITNMGKSISVIFIMPSDNVSIEV